MGILQVILLGGVRVTHNDWLTEVKLTREIQALLAYLLLQRHRSQPREVLADVFWAEYSPEKARRALNTALWRLKNVLEPEGIPSGTYLVCANSCEVRFNCDSQYWLDVEVFEQRTTPVITCSSQTVIDPQVQELEKALELYRGELLEGLYDDWALRERERVRTTYLKSLIFLMQYYKCHEAYEKATAYGQLILNLDPIREDIHREMMRIFLKSGQRALAARQYEICRSKLAQELGIFPMEETQALYAEIFPEAHNNYVSPSSEDTIRFEQLLGQLLQASQALDLAREQVQKALLSFTECTKPEGWNSLTKLSERGGTSKTKNVK